MLNLSPGDSVIHVKDSDYTKLTLVGVHPKTTKIPEEKPIGIGCVFVYDSNWTRSTVITKANFENDNEVLLMGDFNEQQVGQIMITMLECTINAIKQSHGTL